MPVMASAVIVGNQLPILLISFPPAFFIGIGSWESVTNPLDKLSAKRLIDEVRLGISYQSS